MIEAMTPQVMTPEGTQLTPSVSNALPNQLERYDRRGVMSDPDFNDAWVGPTIRAPASPLPRQPR